MTDIVARPSPNRDARPAGVAIDMLVLHYTGMPSAEAALARLTDPVAKVSAHYLVDEDGTLYALVAEVCRAWHAGVSAWHGRGDVNGRSIGVEIVNPGHEFGYRPFPEAQMAVVEALGRDLVARHPIPPPHVLGHSDVAPGRRQDPGELFDWARLAAVGVGLWPTAKVARGEMGLTLGPGDGGAPVAEVQRALAEFGYGVPTDGAFDATTEQVVAAFQRHFRPRLIDGIVDPETAQRVFQRLAHA